MTMTMTMTMSMTMRMRVVFHGPQVACLIERNIWIWLVGLKSHVKLILLFRKRADKEKKLEFLTRLLGVLHDNGV